MNQILHIVSFDIPYPANYGGVIDVFHKIRWLHQAGIGIHLHCFQYQREPAPELEQYCKSIHYYPRDNTFSANLSIMPFIVRSRMSVRLRENLLLDTHPVLFEGLHTCGYIADPRLKDRLLIYRESNIEHHYYYHLSKAEKHFGKKLFFLAESMRLKLFQSTLRHASVMLAVSQEDTRYLARTFPQNRVFYLPSFHGHDAVNILPGRGTYALYQGKLSVPENSLAAEFLISEVWEDAFPELIIAGMKPPGWLKKLTDRRKNIRLIENPSEEEMQHLVQQAHVNIMVTFQPTGLKLKLLNALFNGRFCLVNPQMVSGTNLGSLCHLASDPYEFKQMIKSLFSDTFTEKMVAGRTSLLLENYSNVNNCNQLVNLLTLQK